MSEPPDNRLLALRAAGQEATDFQLDDARVRRFMELHDAGADEATMAHELHVEPEVVAELVRADKAQALARRIAAGEEKMFPPPSPEERVVDTRFGSSAVPALALVLVLAGVIVYVLLR